MQSTPLYRTAKGEAYVGNSLELLAELPDNCIDLVMTSPPFALRRQKSYGNVEETEYVQWIKPFGQEVFRVLKESGSFVLDLGGAYRSGVPSRSLYNFRVLLAFCDEIGFQLTEDSNRFRGCRSIVPDSVLTFSIKSSLSFIRFLRK